MVLNFRTGIELTPKKICKDSRVVAISYIKGWFFLDFVAWLPSILALALGSHPPK